MLDTSDIKKGVKITLDGQPYNCVEFQFVKPGKGQAFTRTKLKNMITGAVLERTFKSGEKLEKAELEERGMTFTYMDGPNYVFMDKSTYEEHRLSEEQLADVKYYMLDGIDVDVLLYEGRPIGVTPPNFVELEVVQTDPGFKGDTATGATKAAELSSGLTVQVPLFVEQGEWLKIDTRTNSYVERVKK